MLIIYLWTIGGLFKDLDLAIAMQTFISILNFNEISKIENIVNRNEDLVSIIALLQEATKKFLDLGAKVKQLSIKSAKKEEE